MVKKPVKVGKGTRRLLTDFAGSWEMSERKKRL